MKWIPTDTQKEATFSFGKLEPNAFYSEYLFEENNETGKKGTLTPLTHVRVSGQLITNVPIYIKDSYVNI